jgi:hypothetical protein
VVGDLALVVHHPMVDAAAAPVPAPEPLAPAMEIHAAAVLSPEELAIAASHVIVFNVGRHSIKYYKHSRTFTAECGLDGHVKCVLTRQAIGSPVLHRAGQGRCLALLWTWLHDCPGIYDRYLHVHSWPRDCTFALRSAHRATLMGMDSAIMRALLAHERPPRDGEGLEPVAIC